MFTKTIERSGKEYQTVNVLTESSTYEVAKYENVYVVRNLDPQRKYDISNFYSAIEVAAYLLTLENPDSVRHAVSLIYRAKREYKPVFRVLLSLKCFDETMLNLLKQFETRDDIFPIWLRDLILSSAERANIDAQIAYEVYIPYFISRFLSPHENPQLILEEAYSDALEYMQEF